MSGRPSAATERALKRIAKGEPAFSAAQKEGVSPSTLYRALARGRRKFSRLTGKVIPRCACGKAVYADGKCYAHFQDRLR
jgi:hypothetical protein